jgi:spore coat protein F
MVISTRDRFIVGDILGFAKAGVRNTSLAITETSTPFVRETLVGQLRESIEMHERVFNYMLKHGLYPSYHVEQVIQGDFQNAHLALNMPVHKSVQ